LIIISSPKYYSTGPATFTPRIFFAFKRNR